MARLFNTFKASANTAQTGVSFGAEKGLNERVLEQLLDASSASSLINYIQDGQGRLETRKGEKSLGNKSGVTTYLAGKHWYGDYFLVGYGTTVAAFNKTTGVFTEIKTNFSKSITDIEVYGYWGLVASGYNGNKIFRISNTLSYGTLVGAFQANETITGGTSGATAIIFTDAAGVITMDNMVGTFVLGETITGGTSTATAVLTSALTFVATEISSSSPADVLFIRSTSGGGDAGTRLFLGGVAGNKRKVLYTAVDTGTNPPWNQASDWDTSVTTATAAGFIIVPDDVVDIGSRGNMTQVLTITGRVSFDITVIDSAGTLVQDLKSRDYRDHGGAKGIIDTTFGTFYLGVGGLYLLKSETNEEVVSKQLLQGYFDDVTFTNSTIVHFAESGLILASYAKDAVKNNEVLVFNTRTGAISFIKGWNIAQFMRDDNGVIYGLSAYDGKVYQLFYGFEDDGKAITTEVSQAVQKAPLDASSLLEWLEIQAVLFEDAPITIHFDVENIDGGFVQDYQVWQLEGVASGAPLQSWGSASYGSAGWGSGSGGLEIEPQRYTTDLNIEFLSCKIRITSANKTPHTINYYLTKTRQGSPVNLNNITQIS